jgi:hypothetical protein
LFVSPLGHGHQAHDQDTHVATDKDSNCQEKKFSSDHRIHPSALVVTGKAAICFKTDYMIAQISDFVGKGTVNIA